MDRSKTKGFILAAMVTPILLLSCSGKQKLAGDPAEVIEQSFVNPPSEVRPGVFWDWLNGNMTKERITSDLEAMASKGIMMAVIWDIAAGHRGSMIPAGPAAFMSDESVALIKFAIAEAKRLNMHINLITASSWNEGGSWVDRAFCEGLNMVTYHTFASTPPEAGYPGWTYHAGIDMNRSSTWWEKSKPFSDYLARCCYLLRQGLFVADACYYYGDQAPNFFPAYHDVPKKPRIEGLDAGYDYDVVNTDVILNRMTVRNGRVMLPDGMSYALMIVPEQAVVPSAVWEKLQSFVKAGVVIIGQRFDKTATADEVLARMGIGKDFEFPGSPSLDYIHRTTNVGEVYFIRNASDAHWAKGEARFRVTGKYPEQWDAATGIQTQIPEYKEENGFISLPVELPPHGSVFIVFNPQKRNLPQPASFAGLAEQPLTTSWTVNFPAGWGVPEEVVFSQLQSWTDVPDESVKYFSGTATYRTTFSLPHQPTKSCFLDLGEVRDVAEVFVNGHSVGILWKQPFIADISGLVKASENELKIEVVNMWINRLTGDLKLKPEERYCHTNHPDMVNFQMWPEGNSDEAYREQLSGLLGPVKILFK